MDRRESQPQYPSKISISIFTDIRERNAAWRIRLEQLKSSIWWAFAICQKLFKWIDIYSVRKPSFYRWGNRAQKGLRNFPKGTCGRDMIQSYHPWLQGLRFGWGKKTSAGCRDRMCRWAYISTTRVSFPLLHQGQKKGIPAVEWGKHLASTV